MGFVFGLTAQDIQTYYPSTPTDADFDKNILLMNGDGTNEANNNTIIDSSTNNLTITKTGTPIQGSFSPFTNGGSIYFNGTTDKLTFANNSGLAFGTGDFSVEGWFYNSNGFTSQQFLLCVEDGANNHSLVWGTLGTGTFFVSLAGVSYYNIGSTTGITANTWTHLALVRQSGMMKLYINGTQSGSSVSDSLDYYGQATQIGATGSLYSGFISNYRIVKGTAVYTSTFTPPTSPLTAITNTTLLLSGTNAGVKDLTNLHNINTVGTQISTTQTKYGSGSLYSSGSTNSLYTTPHTNNWLGTGDFTIEFWTYPTSQTSTAPHVISNYDPSQGWSANTWAICAGHPQNSGKWSFFDFNISSIGPTLSGTANVSANTWQHIALVRNGTSLKLYVNGTSVASTTSSTSLDNSTITSKYIRLFNDGTNSNPFVGYIDDLRITKGLARYTANFTPPTEALPTQ